MIQKYGLYLSWMIASIAMLISLYFSEIMLLEPCHLCWYQRICLFPLAFILGIAAYKGFTDIVYYVIPLPIFGFLFAAYQVAIQEIPNWQPIDMCGSGPNCTDKLDIGLGFLSIPMLSMLGFFIIGFLLMSLWWTSRRSCTVTEESYGKG